MKHLLATALLVFSFFQVSAQILQPATWSYKTSANEVNIGEETELIFIADIDPEWYLYSSDFDSLCGPQITRFKFVKDPSFELIGGIRPIKAKEKYDDIFECDIKYFAPRGEFRQTIRVLKEKVRVKVFYDYQVCTDIDGRCIPFDDEYVFSGIKGLVSKQAVEEPLEPIEKTEPEEEPNANDSTTVEEIAQTETAVPEKEVIVETKDGYPVKSMAPFFEGEYQLQKISYWWFMILAFIAGLAAILTPCVFPLIPMTVAFFTNKDKGNGLPKALFYGFCIVLIFTLMGAIVAPVMGPETANHLATEWLPNILFSLVFLFSLSLFSVFLILPFLTSLSTQ